jgi:probable rRNA maturation factor
VRIVNPQESQTLNARYRKKNNPTNILSFTYDIEDNQQRGPYLEGDLVICAEIVTKEALEQQKPVLAHWAHLIVHGILHLLGLDHESEKEAKCMESLEILLLAQLGFQNPYTQNLGENHV